MSSKILSQQDADRWIYEQRASDRTVGFTCGAFDLLHAGHIDLLKKAKEVCDRLLVAVNSTASIKSYKSPLRPVISENNRILMIASLESVDAVVLMREARPLSLIERWKPDFYIKGGDYSSKGLQSATTVESFGGKVVIIPFVSDESTSAIIERVTSLHVHATPTTPLVSKHRPIVFLDRDGTLIRNIPFLHQPERVELLPGVGEGLARLQAAGFRLVVVTNQQGIGLGYYSMDQFFHVNQALFRELKPFGALIDKVYFCSHSVADKCACRKPGIGMLERALKDFEADRDRSWIIGDSDCDREAGERAGICAIQLSEPAANFKGEPPFSNAVNQILSSSASFEVAGTTSSTES